MGCTLVLPKKNVNLVMSKGTYCVVCNPHATNQITKTKIVAFFNHINPYELLARFDFLDR